MRRLAALALPLALGACATFGSAPSGRAFQVFFAPTISTLDHGGDGVVTAAAAFANRYPHESVVVAGYLAPPGHRYVESADTDTLRAKAVTDQLVADGVDPTRIVVHSMGVEQPVVPMSKIEVRRVDIIVGSPDAK
jgi:outer membrane protein OmpA-like peptidoglycan-associated protein